MLLWRENLFKPQPVPRQVFGIKFWLGSSSLRTEDLRAQGSSCLWSQSGVQFGVQLEHKSLKLQVTQDVCRAKTLGLFREHGHLLININNESLMINYSVSPSCQVSAGILRTARRNGRWCQS